MLKFWNFELEIGELWFFSKLALKYKFFYWPNFYRLIFIKIGLIVSRNFRAKNASLAFFSIQLSIIIELLWTTTFRIYCNDAVFWKWFGVPVVKGEQNLPPLVGIRLTYLPNIRGGTVAPQFRHPCIESKVNEWIKRKNSKTNHATLLDRVSPHTFIHYLVFWVECTKRTFCIGIHFY